MSATTDREEMLNQFLVEKSVDIFAALADPTRLKMLRALMERGELTVSDLVDVSGVSQSATSHQLRTLKDKALVDVRREGQFMYYSIADDHIVSLLEQGLAHAAHARFSEEEL